MDGLPTPEDDLAWRLANVESRLEALSERLGRLESSLRAAVADEVQGATAELRRAISELGRRLVQDLPHELARHRDAIVAELRPPAPPPPAVLDLQATADPPPALAPPVVDEDGAEDDAGDAGGVGGVGGVGAPEAGERRRGHRLRRRPG